MMLLRHKLQANQPPSFPHEQQAKRPRPTVAGNGGGCLMEVDPLKGSVLLHQLLNVSQALFIHPCIHDEQNPPVNTPRVSQHLSHIALRHPGKPADLYSTHGDPALPHHHHRVQQQGIAEELYPFGNQACLAHHVSAVNEAGRGEPPPEAFHRFDDILFRGVIFCHCRSV